MKNRSRCFGLGSTGSLIAAPFALFVAISAHAEKDTFGNNITDSQSLMQSLAGASAAPKQDIENCVRPLRKEWATAEEIQAAERNWEQGTRVVSLSEIPPQHQPPAPIQLNEYAVGKEIRKWDGPTSKIYSPVRVRNSEGKIENYFLGTAPEMTREHGWAAYQTARAAWANGQGEWPSMSLRQRAAAIERLTVRMKEESAKLKNWLMWEIGKSPELSSGEVDRTIKFMEDQIGLLDRWLDTYERIDQRGNFFYTLGRQPLGVALAFAPYNYPLNETFTGIIPALLVGNTLVMKPARWGVLFTQILARLFHECLPPGVVNFIYGSNGKELLEELQASGGYEIFSFTGGERGAAAIMRTNTRPNRTTAVLGLGAKNMAVVLDDADLSNAIAKNLKGCLSYNGQRCTAHKILFVQRGIADSFIKGLAKGMDELPIGGPYQQGVSQTASPDTGWTEKMNGYVKEAVDKGARIGNLLGGRSANGFYAPTLLVGVTPEMKIYREEQFGPVVPVVIFDHMDEVIRWQEESNYGQQAAIFGSSPDQVQYIRDALLRMVHRTFINTDCERGPDDLMPFGARGDSGQGDQGLWESLLRYTINSGTTEYVIPGRQPLLNYSVRVPR